MIPNSAEVFTYTLFGEGREVELEDDGVGTDAGAGGEVQAGARTVPAVKEERAGLGAVGDVEASALDFFFFTVFELLVDFGVILTLLGGEIFLGLGSPFTFLRASSTLRLVETSPKNVKQEIN